MLAPGHIAIGVASYMGICAVYGYEPAWYLYGVAAIGSLLPDIDHPTSQVGKLLPTVSNAIARVMGHRGFTHSLLAVILFMSILFQSMESLGTSIFSAIITALCLGYLSHLVGDFFTLAGIPLLWPLGRKFDFRKKQHGYRMPFIAIRTGSTTEYILTTALVVLVAYEWVY